MENLILGCIVALATIVSGALTDLVKRFIKTDKKWVNILVMFILSILTTFVAWIIGYIPAFFQPEWLSVLFEGLTVGVLASGIYGFPIVKKIYDFIFQFIDGKWYEIEKKDDNK